MEGEGQGRLHYFYYLILRRGFIILEVVNILLQLCYDLFNNIEVLMNAHLSVSFSSAPFFTMKLLYLMIKKTNEL